jgi:cell division protein FtsL
MARAAAATAAPARPATTAGRAAPARHQPARRQPARRPATPAKRPTRRASGQAAPRRAARTARLPLGARMLDALLSGRVWIGLVGVLLAGIVFFNVDLLRMNREITHMADRAAQLKRENARIREDVAGLASSERIQQAAAGLGLVLPVPAQVRYLKSNPLIDARTASKRIIPPDPSVAPDPIVAETPTTTTTAPTTTTPTTTTATPSTTTTTSTTPPTTTTPPTSTTAASPTG